MKKTITLICCSAIMLFAADSDILVNEREAWSFTNTNTMESGEPSNLKYFKFLDALPDEISMEVFSSKDLEQMKGKKIFIGYGVVDPEGKNCKKFPPSVTGMQNDITICLPWWRIERIYQKEYKNVNDLRQFFKTIPRPKPPITVNYCKTWKEGAVYPGGMVTCTTYYDKFISSDCYANPLQNKCFVDNCGQYLVDNCIYNGMSLPLDGHNKLQWAEVDTGYAPKKVDAKVNLSTRQFACPAGKIIPHTECLDEVTAMMYPYTCKEDDPSTIVDDGEYKYCDEKKPAYDASGNIIGFIGKCSDGREVMCDINKLASSTRKCEDPVKITETETEDSSVTAIRGYELKTVDVISGEPDIYSTDPNCLRANTIEESREGKFTARVIGAGNLDDDIFVLAHKEGGDLEKIYCNQQHNGSHPHKTIDGVYMSCIPNSGTYSFDKTIAIDSTSIVSVQQATEHDAYGGYFFSGHTHFRSTDLKIENVLVAPSVVVSKFKYYPNHKNTYLKLGENGLGTLALLFPFSGAYQLYFYDKNGQEMASALIGQDDFEAMGDTGNMQLKLGKIMNIVVNEDKACKEDDFVAWGGGVYGGRASRTGESCAGENTTYVKNHKVVRVLIKDLLTGQVTNVPLVYGLGYPNRVFISKLKLREKRKYRCYKPFPVEPPR